MPIQQITTDFPGQEDVNPRLVRIQCNDSYATVTTAGYLSGAQSEGYVFLPTDLFAISYGSSPSVQSWFEPSFSGNTITLIPSTSGVVLPTIANHIATYSNTSGLLTEDAATAINGGSIQAGLSGTSGAFISFPPTPAKGSLVLKAVANTGNTNTTISNAAMGQATTVNIPDPGTASTNFLLTNSAGNQSISTGNLILTLGSFQSQGSITAVAGGVQAGSSGNAGTFTTFPSTASTGYMQIVGASNAGNTAVIITNASFGQASTLTIPDPAGATANFALAPSALVSGNLVKASGTAGLLLDAGVAAAALGTLTATITLTQSQIQNAYATPVQLIAAPGTGKAIMVLNAAIYTNFQTAAFTGGGVAIVQYDTTVHGAGTNALSATIPAAEITAAASQIYALNESTATVLTGITNKGVFFSNQTGAFTAGNAASTVVITLTYQVLTATV